MSNASQYPPAAHLVERGDAGLRPAAGVVWRRRVLFVGGMISAGFVLATALAHCLFRDGTATLPGFVLFDVDSEANLPTWYASMLLQGCALLAFTISFHDAASQRMGWRGIAVILLLMGMDEVASLHNVPSRMLREMVGVADGFLMNAWVIPAGGVVVALALIYLPFFWRLPRWLKRALAGATSAYLLGAVGFEVLGSHFEYHAGGLSYNGSSLYSFRFEMTGVAEEAFEHIGVLATLAIFLKHAACLDARLVLDLGRMQIRGGAAVD